MPATIFCLHALGSSSREFDHLDDLLAGVELLGIDLPGFGATPVERGTTVLEMSRMVEDVIRSTGRSDWALLGHSMGGKIAQVVAGRTMDGSNGLFGLRAVMLLAASPLSPEPMAQERREAMLSWVSSPDPGGRDINPHDAEEFVAANVSGPLDPSAFRVAVDDVRRTSPLAWRAWLQDGSREDLSGLFSPCHVPVLVLAGADDGDLDADAQRDLVLPHWPAAELHEIPGAAHLLPWEQPDAVAELIRGFLGRRVDLGPVVSPRWGKLIASERVGADLRSVLAERALPDDPSRTPTALSGRQLDTLRTVAGHVVPQPGGPGIDLAARVDRQLGLGQGDGWRPDGSPPDPVAYQVALDELADSCQADPGEFQAVLDAVAAGDHPTRGPLDPEHLRAWLEDATVDLVRVWLAHPATMEFLGYDGFATGGDHGLEGFDLTLLDETISGADR